MMKIARILSLLLDLLLLGLSFSNQSVGDKIRMVLLLVIFCGGILVGFLLVRALDVAKPFPARRLERLHGGFGVMADDAMAAVYANVLLRGAHHLAPGWLS